MRVFSAPLYTKPDREALELEMGKNPHCLSSVLFGFYQISRVRSVRVLSRYGKMKVRFWFGSLCRVFGSVRFGSMRVLVHIYLVYICVKNPPSILAFLALFPKRLGIFSPNFTYLLFFLCTLYRVTGIDYKFLFNSPTVTKSCHIKCDHPACVSADGSHFEHMMWTGWSHLIWHFHQSSGNWIQICSLA